jgi:hypothetical protein
MVIELSGFSDNAGVDSKSRQSAFRNASLVFSFVFLWASLKKRLKKSRYSSLPY